MDEILEVLEKLAIYCNTTECHLCRFTRHTEGTVEYDCNIDALADQLYGCPCYWDLDRIKEILKYE